MTPEPDKLDADIEALLAESLIENDAVYRELGALEKAEKAPSEPSDSPENPLDTHAKKQR